MMNQKQEALLAAAYDFYEHGRVGYVQYDQKSMDRVLQLTPRRRKYLPPEAGTAQNTLFSDCSGFCFQAYYQAFGYELPSDLTWHMMNLLKPRVFYYERTFNETAEERARIAEEFLNCLQPGDLIDFQVNGNGGHIMLYVGDGKYLHCTSGPFRGTDYSYDYVNKKNQDRPQGGVRFDEAKYLVCDTPEGPKSMHYFFKPTYSRMGVFRPLELVGEPTPQALVRMTKYRGLWTVVESSRYGGEHALPGETVEYRVVVRNLTEEPKTAEVCFEAPEGSVLKGSGEAAVTLAAGEEQILRFEVAVDEDTKGRIKLEGPAVTVNDLEIYTYPVLLGKGASEEEQKQVTERVLAEMSEGCDAVKAASIAYGEYGISMESRKEEYLFSHFCLHDATVGIDVVSRRPQKPFEDMSVYSYFGGTGVITPEMGSSTGIRATRVSVHDLMPGDIILCSNDTFGKRSYASYYDGTCLTGSFDAGDAMKTLRGEEMAAFVDSLFGRFCWIVLRPWNAR